MRPLVYLILSSFLFLNCGQQQEIKSITTKAFKEVLSKQKVQLLDVRTLNEVQNGFIKSAIFSDYYGRDFYTKAASLIDKEKPVYVYCKSGNRSVKAAKILQKKGIEVYNVLGGYQQWETEN